MPDLDLSITICSWNTRDDLRACLASLRAAQGEGKFEVIVVDNNSEDGSAEMVAEEFPEMRLIRSRVNLGFTGGHNLAMDHRVGRDAALLNSDTIVHPGAIGKIIQYLADHPEIGLLGPKLLNPDGSLQYSCRTFPNPVAAAFRNTILGRVFPKNKFTRDYLMSDWNHNEPREVDWLSGAALFARGDFIDSVGLLDPEYFMFCEDVDWCRRAWDAGFKVVYYPDAVITHAIGRSTDKAPNRMITTFHAAMLRYYAKHVLPLHHPFARPFYYLFAAFALGTRAALFLIKNKWDALMRAVRS